MQRRREFLPDLPPDWHDLIPNPHDPVGLQIAMSTTAIPEQSQAGLEDAGVRLARLGEVIEHAAHLLPVRGPITVFIHHNTLHAFEDLPFHEAVKKAARVFGCQPYLSEERYREALNRGRIRASELQEVLEEDLGAGAATPVPCVGTRLGLRLARLQYPLASGSREELVWYIAEANALRRVRPEASSAVRGRRAALIDCLKARAIGPVSDPGPRVRCDRAPGPSG